MPSLISAKHKRGDSTVTDKDITSCETPLQLISQETVVDRVGRPAKLPPSAALPVALRQSYRRVFLLSCALNLYALQPAESTFSDVVLFALT